LRGQSGDAPGRQGRTVLSTVLAGSRGRDRCGGEESFGVSHEGRPTGRRRGQPRTWLGILAC
jgi:hypothetical protein